MKDYEDANVLCPFYHAVEKQKIKCDGVEETNATHPVFASEKKKQEYMDKYCCGDWGDCRYANMLTMMWEERLARK